MKEIMDAILQAEKRAKQTVQMAHEQAANLKRQAEIEALKKIERARRKAKELVASRVEAERKKAIQLRDEKLGRAEEQGKTFLETNRQEVDNLVREIVELIIKTVYEDEGGA